MVIIVSDVAAQMGGAIVILKGLYNYIKENDHENEKAYPENNEDGCT